MNQILMDHTFFIVLTGTFLVGLVSGTLGAFSLLRKECLLGDAISHATLPGIAITFLITHSKEMPVLILGAISSAWIGILIMKVLIPKTTLKSDASLGIILSVFFGFGTLLLSIIQHLSIPNQAGLHKFLFGNASTLLKEDIAIIAIIGSICLLAIIMLWKEFTLITFHPEFAQSIGLPIKRLDLFLTALTILAIVSGIQMSGVILMSAILVAPAAAARQWTNRFGLMVILSALFGASSGVLGTICSSSIGKLPTGPAIALIMSTWTLLSLLFAPCRGIFWSLFRKKYYRHKFSHALSIEQPSIETVIKQRSTS